MEFYVFILQNFHVILKYGKNVKLQKLTEKIKNIFVIFASFKNPS